METQRWEETERRKSQKKEDAGTPKGRKVAKHSAFPMLWGGRSKSRLAKAAGAEPSGQMRNESPRRCGAKHISKSKCAKTPHVRSTFESWDLRFGASDRQVC